MQTQGQKTKCLFETYPELYFEIAKLFFFPTNFRCSSIPYI